MKKATAYYAVYRKMAVHYDFAFTSAALFLHCIIAALIYSVTPMPSLGDLWTEGYFEFLRVRVWITLPMVLDLIIDVRGPLKNRSRLRSFFPRLLLTLTLVIPEFVKLYLPYDSNPFLASNIQGAFVLTQPNFLVACLMTSMYWTEEESNSSKQDNDDDDEKFSIQLGNIHCLLLTFLAKVFFFFARLTSSPTLYVATVLIVVFAMTHLIWVIVQQCLKLYHQSEKGRFTSHRPMSDFLHMIVLLLYILILFSYFVFYLVGGHGIRFAFGRTFVSPFGMMIQILFVVLLTVIPMRVHLFHAQLESTRLKTKLDTIRYVSHEMRSPLNTVVMGLKCVEEQLNSFRSAESRKENVVTSFHNQLGYGSLKAVISQDEESVNSGSSLDRGAMSELSVHSLEDLEGDGTSKDMQEILDNVGNVKTNCDVVLATLNDLLMVDKLEEDKLTLDLSALNPWEVVKQVANSFLIAAKESDVEFTVECRDEGSRWFERWELVGDFFKLSQVIRNFISNAIKFTPPRGRVTVTLELVKRECPVFANSGSSSEDHQQPQEEQEGEFSALLTVRDSGAGISTENLTKLFGQYVQFDAAKLQQGKGSGLGLWISKRIVELHGGTIGAKSDGQGCGSTFFFEIQLQRKEISVNKPEVPGLLLNLPRPAPRRDSLSGRFSRGFSAFGSSRISARSISESDDEVSVDLERGVPNAHLRRFKTFAGTTGRGNLSSRSALSTASYERNSIARYTAKVAPTLIPDCDCDAGVDRWDKGLSMLLVDDSNLTRKLCARLLEGAGHRVQEFADGLDFVDFVRQKKKEAGLFRGDGPPVLADIDVVLMDDSMPGLCGPDATKQARELGFQGLLVGVTGNVFEEQIKRYLDNGANLVLQKPLDLDRLKEVLCCFLCPEHGITNLSLGSSKGNTVMIPQSR